jgi:putative urate catabolism protein
MSYPRDLRGYGAQPPHPRWPGQATAAVQIVVNFEAGGEHSVLHGDDRSENFLLEEPAQPVIGGRSFSAESQYEYESRAGFWRLFRLLTERQLPVTVYGVTTALARAPEAVAAMQEAGWEIACHGLRWIDYTQAGPDDERRAIRAAIELHTEVTGARPTGWYTGRMSAQTRQLLVEAGGFSYDSDAFNDDLPYWTVISGHPHLVIPYTLDNNDVRYLSGYGYGGQTFGGYLTGALDFLRAEGRTAPKMMSVGLHGRIAGKPGRAADLTRFLDRLAGLDDVWVTRRIDIAQHWRGHFPAPAATAG